MKKRASGKTAPQSQDRHSESKTDDRKRWSLSYTAISKLAFCIFMVLGAWLIYLDAVITGTFEGKKWAIPAKVYARPVNLHKGMRLAPDILQSQLRRQGYQAVRRIGRPGTFSRQGNRFEIYVRGFLFPNGARDAVRLRVGFAKQVLSRLQTFDGKDLAAFRLDPQLMGGIYPASHEDRILVQLKDVPKTMVQGLVAVEDHDFYHHWGISVKGIARALAANIAAGELIQGGSTLTQQLVKNFYLDNRRSLTRKIEEAFMSLLLEWHYSKAQILETYLNEIYLGQQGQRSINGFALASQFYFARPLSELDLAKQALLVAIVKGPSFYNPRRYPERAKERRNLVLDKMVEEGVVSTADAEQAKQKPLDIVTRQRLKANAFPAYIDLVKRQLRQDYRDTDLTSDGLRVFTNMDPIVQQQAQESLSRRVKQLDGGKDGGLEAAMVVTSAKTGEIQAVVGGRDAGFAGFNRALDARRPIGSLVKPAVFLTALVDPSRYTLATLIKDEPITITDRWGSKWSPANYSRMSHGEVPLYLALAKSYNQATARLGMDVGVSAVVKTLIAMGLTRDVQPFPSLLLGSLDLVPVEVAAMYQTLATGGLRVPLRAIDAVVDARGQSVARYNLSVERAFSADLVELVRHALQRVMREGTGRTAYRRISSSIQLAGKTGTTDELRDSWFAGFSEDTLAVVWLGRDDNAASRYTGGTGALQIWTDFMAKRPLQSLAPADLSTVAYFNIDKTTGLMGGSGCENDISLPFIQGSEPQENAPCVQVSPDKVVVDWFEALFR